jgi:hypothetical protein
MSIWQDHPKQSYEYGSKDLLSKYGFNYIRKIKNNEMSEEGSSSEQIVERKRDKKKKHKKE